MWFAIAIIASILLAVTAIPRNRTEEIKASTIEDLDFPRAEFGDAIPVIYGTVKQKSPVLMWYGGFEVGPISQNGVTTGFHHYLGMDLALCLGPNVRLREIWSEQHQVWGPGSAHNELLTINFPNLYGGETQGGGLVGQCSFWSGNEMDDPDPQLQDSYLLGVGIMPLPSYAGIAHIVMRGLNYGTSPTPKPYSFVITRIPNALNPSKAMLPNGFDCNPMEVVYDAITSDWGGVGMSPDVIDIPSFTAASNTLYSEGLGMSLLVQNAVEAKTVLEECMRIADGVLYQEPTTGKIKVKLIRNESTTGLVHLNESNIIGDLKNWDKTLWDSTFNQVRVSFDDRSKFYNSSIAMAQDFAAVNGKARIRSSSITVNGIKDPTVAGKIANRQLALVNVPLYSCEIRTNRIAADLRPGSLFKLSWSRYNVSELVMRVTKIDLGELKNGEITINCVQDRFASNLNNTGAISVIIDPGYEPPEEIPESDAYLMVPPLFKARGYGSPAEALALARSAGRFSPVYRYPIVRGSNGVEVRTNVTPNTSTGFKSGGGINGWGVLLNDYPASVAKDSYVDLSQSLIIRCQKNENRWPISQKITDPAFEGGNRLGGLLIQIGEEVFTYFGKIEFNQTSTTYDLKFTEVWRGLLDSRPLDHLAGERAIVLRGPVEPPVPYGSSIWASFHAKTTNAIYENAEAYEFEMNNKRQMLPLTPQALKLSTGIGDPVRNPAPINFANLHLPGINYLVSNRSRTDYLLCLPAHPSIQEEPFAGTTAVIVDNEPVNANWQVGTLLKWKVTGPDLDPEDPDTEGEKFHYGWAYRGEVPSGMGNGVFGAAGAIGPNLLLTVGNTYRLTVRAYGCEIYWRSYPEGPGGPVYGEDKSLRILSTHYDEQHIDITRT